MREKLMKNMGYLIVLVDICVYFILSYVFVESFQVNLLSIIVNGALLFVGAMIATGAMTKQGLLIGQDTERYKETLAAHLTQKQKIYSKLNLLQDWLDYDYLKLLKIGRSVYVNSAGYDYGELFDANGKFNSNFKIKKPEPIVYKKWYQRTLLLPLLKLFRWIFSDEWNLYREKKRFVKKAKKYKVTRLTVSDLMNVNADRDPNNFGITENQYQRRQNGVSFASRLIFSILLQSVSFGFYGFNITTFLVQLLCIVMIVLFAFFSMFSSYSFIVKTHRESIIKKINKLEEFDNDNKALETIQKNRKEEQKNDEICSAIPVCTKSSVVETIHRQGDIGKTNNICGN